MAHRRERTVILAALFIALSVALGFLHTGIPNVEVKTLTVFLAGAFCGARLGCAVGALSILVHSLFNPLGPAPAPLLAAQVACFVLIGAAGGIVGPRIEPSRGWSIVACAAAGFALTLVYDAVTTLATAFIALGASRFIGGLRGFAVAGIGFTTLHEGVNTAIFAVAVPPLMKAVRAWQGGEAS